MDGSTSSGPSEKDFRPPLSVKANLSEVLSQTNSSGTKVCEPEVGEPNSFYGILNWNSRDKQVTAKQVLGEDKLGQETAVLQGKSRVLSFSKHKDWINSRATNKLLDTVRSAGENLSRELMVPFSRRRRRFGTTDSSFAEEDTKYRRFSESEKEKVARPVQEWKGEQNLFGS